MVPINHRPRLITFYNDANLGSQLCGRCCRGDTGVSVKITCGGDEKEKIVLKVVLMAKKR